LNGKRSDGLLVVFSNIDDMLLDLETAMDMIADRVWNARERTFEEKRDDEWIMHTTAIAHLGGATLDNEENYLIKKLFAAGLGMVCISTRRAYDTARRCPVWI
jgi:hypothetical protein